MYNSEKYTKFYDEYIAKDEELKKLLLRRMEDRLLKKYVRDEEKITRIKSKFGEDK